ncbi:hypothetical protein FRC14_002301 [Serendipita sp. 396]|nr:hypothetical protein FRC14_002301 [Serendipita sp. 396]KAG8784787.1 hypothetical protein FRC15_002602 [Serendipita sp. 397]KAG8800520.1 hypothetical protein FRC16_002709 [Serendipita sp. 398]KAG8823725.1 hypothetical protein FRC19_003282 [Serendipita sp. 401]KAG8834204.1 hypothetical protein FRC18_002360 [Serendipita sp. 400]
MEDANWLRVKDVSLARLMEALRVSSVEVEEAEGGWKEDNTGRTTSGRFIDNGLKTEDVVHHVGSKGVWGELGQKRKASEREEEQEEEQQEENAGLEEQLEEGALPLTKRRRKNQRRHLKQKENRSLKDKGDSLPRPRSMKRTSIRVIESSTQRKRPFAVPKKLGYTGSQKRTEASSPSSNVEKLENLGYNVIKADDEAFALLDEQDRVVFVRAKRPSKIQETALNTLDERLEDMLPNAYANSSRGEFKWIQMGVHHGNGTMEPHLFSYKDHPTLKAKVEEFLSTKEVHSVTTHLRNALNVWFPLVGQLLKEKTKEIMDKLPQDAPFWPGSPWTTATINLGPQTVTKAHTDSNNLAFGLCAVFVTGQFDSSSGGHLVLHDFKLVLETRPGDLFLFPSAVFTHGNTPVSKSENRKSIVWWICGNSARYFDMGSRPIGKLSTDGKKKQREWEESAFKDGLDRFLTLEQLRRLHSHA